MYRHSTHTICAGCGAPLAYQEAELDSHARYICTACGARDRFDTALVRWRRQSTLRNGWTRVGLAAVALFTLIYLLPSLLLFLLRFFFLSHFC